MIVVDTSVIVDVLTDPVDTADLRGLLRAADELHAPALLDYEVVESLRGLTLGRRVSKLARRMRCRTLKICRFSGGGWAMDCAAEGFR